MYFIDSNTYIYFDKTVSKNLTAKLLAVSTDKLKIPAMVAAELRLGAEKSARRDYNLDRLERFLALYEIVPFDNEAAKHYAIIRAALEKSGQIIGANDLVIAATVLSNNGTLITRNTKEFSRVSGLNVEDWY